MLRRTLLTIAATLGVCLAAPACKTDGDETHGRDGGSTAVASGYAPVNGLRMYYEIHGAGKPLVLIHGGFASIGMFKNVLPALAKTRRVVAVELQGHGHTADVDRPLGYEQMADDTVALMDHIGVENADVFGFSLGGGVAQQMAIRHPETVGKLVLASAPRATDGWYPEIRAGIAGVTPEDLISSPWYEEYLRVAPRPQDWPVLVAKLRQLLTDEVYDWTTSVAAIHAPVLLVVGDSDSVLHAHTLETFRLLGGGVAGDVAPLPKVQLAIVPGTAHSTLVSRGDLLSAILPPFLDPPAQ